MHTLRSSVGRLHTEEKRSWVLKRPFRKVVNGTEASSPLCLLNTLFSRGYFWAFPFLLGASSRNMWGSNRFPTQGAARSLYWVHVLSGSRVVALKLAPPSPNYLRTFLVRSAWLLFRTGTDAAVIWLARSEISVA